VARPSTSGRFVDGGFQELVRLGELSATDADVRNSLTVLDTQIAVGDAVRVPATTGTARRPPTQRGRLRRLLTSRARPRARIRGSRGHDERRTGHLWPVLSGERAESALAPATGGSPSGSCR